MLIRARGCGAFAVALIALVTWIGVPAHAEVLPSPEPTGEVIDQPALPSGPVPSIEPSIPEGTFDPAPEGPVPTAVPTVAPAAPVGTAPFESTRPSGTVVEPFRSGDATTTSRGTDGQVPRDSAPAPQGVAPAKERTEIPPASPTPAIPTASPTPVVATASPAPDDARGESAGSGAAVRSTSAQKPPTPPLPNLIIGMVVLVGGLVIMRYRGPVYEATVRADKRLITSGSGERAERLQGPFRVGVAGAVVALIGVVMNGYSGWQLWMSLTS